MNSVEKVRKLCKDRGISIAKFERDLGFGNGYVRRLSKGTFPSDRLMKIANYFDVPIADLVGDGESSSIVHADGQFAYYDNDEQQKFGVSMTDAEREIVASYREAPDGIKDAVKKLLDVNQEPEHLMPVAAHEKDVDMSGEILTEEEIDARDMQKAAEARNKTAK